MVGWMVLVLGACGVVPGSEAVPQAPPVAETPTPAPATAEKAVSSGSKRAGYDESLPPGHGWTRSARGPLVPPRDGSPHGPAPEPTLQPDGKMCSTYSCWDPSLEPAQTVAGVRSLLSYADVVVIGEFVGTTEAYGPGRAAKARAEIAAGLWTTKPPPDEELGRHTARRIRVVHEAKGPGNEEILIMGGRGGWKEGQRLIIFGMRADPTDGFPENLYVPGDEFLQGLCVRWPDDSRGESCSGRFHVDWEELEEIVRDEGGRQASSTSMTGQGD